MKTILSKSIETYGLSSFDVIAIIITPIVIVLLSFLLWSIPATRPFTNWMLLENNPVELLTFLSLLAAGVIGIQIAWNAKKNGKGFFIISFYAVFAVGLVFVAMEEISWGQWFFGFKTPDTVQTINKQGELNLHNIPGFHAPFETLRVLFGVGGLIGVWFSRWAFTRWIGAAAILSPWFVIIAVLAAADLHNYYYPITCCPLSKSTVYLVAARMVEVLELLIGMAAFLYMWLNQRRFLGVANT